MTIIMKILIVEDDKFLRLLLERKLKNENFEVVAAEDGEEALEKIVTEKPDLILLDIILPKKSGFAVLEEINKDENLKRIPVFIISNLGQPEDIERGKNLGAKEYFVKAGLSLEELIKKIKIFATEFLSTK
ncbi:MAG: response regulator [Minisyncoccia bacterium]|jgi:DNA-binding response OmpR family regulator